MCAWALVMRVKQARMEAAYAVVESVDGMVPRVGAAFSEARDVVQVVAFSVTLQSWDSSVDHCIYHWFPVVFLQLLVQTGQCRCNGVCWE